MGADQILYIELYLTYKCPAIGIMQARKFVSLCSPHIYISPCATLPPKSLSNPKIPPFSALLGPPARSRAALWPKLVAHCGLELFGR